MGWNSETEHPRRVDPRRVDPEAKALREAAERRSKLAKIIGTILIMPMAIPVAFTIYLPIMLLDTWVMQIGWNRFMPHVFPEVGRLTLGQALGLGIVISIFTRRSDTKVGKSKPILTILGDEISTLVIMLVCIIGISWWLYGR